MKPMNATRALLTVALLGALPLPALAANASGASKQGTTYMWVDKNGERHYGDFIPPEYAQSQKSVLNAQGVEVQRDEAPRSAAERAADTQKAQEKLQRQQHDHFLLTTYTSIHDIERLRDERLTQMNAQIVATNGYIDTIETRLRSLSTRAMEFKPYSDRPNARRLPDDLAEQLVLSATEVRSQRSAIDKQQQDIAAVRAQFDADIVRFHELTAPPAS
jgi:hypothetical protein